jgi:ammonia channel protein AmtB
MARGREYAAAHGEPRCEPPEIPPVTRNTVESLGLIGGVGHLGMHGIGPATPTGHVPTLLFAAFQLTFAIITAALISGAVANRARFGAWVVWR